MKQEYTVTEVLSQQFDTVPFHGKWESLIGEPELTGSWIIWGESGHGKTSFCFQLGKYLSSFQNIRVTYNSIEEGFSRSIQMAMQREDMASVSDSFMLWNKVRIEELQVKLKHPQAPNVIFIDSIQYTELNKSKYKKLKESNPDKLFIFISHADGKYPSGGLAQFVRYDSNVKIRVHGYRASAKSRFGGTLEPYVIWEQGSDQFFKNIK